MRLSTEAGIDDQFTFRVTRNGASIDISSWGLIFSIMDTLPKVTPDIQKKNASEGGGSTEIDMTNATEGIFVVLIDASDTTGLLGEYYFDCKKRVSAKFNTLIEVDKFVINQVGYKEP